MKIDIERLKTDREYWDSVAPEGANTYAVNSTNYPWERRNIDGSVDFWMPLSGGIGKWEPSSKRYSFTDEDNRLRITRPEKQWRGPKDGLPPVGSECLAQWLIPPDGGAMKPERVLIKGIFGKQVWFTTHEGEDLVMLQANVLFSPIPSPRDEWIYNAQKHCTEFGSNQIGIIYDALLSGDLPVPGVDYD